MKRKIVIVQPYVPAYRLAFFNRLRSRLADRDIDCMVAAGMPTGEQAHRGDAVTPNWLEPINYKTFEIGDMSALLRIDPAPLKGANAIVMGLGGSSIPVYQALVTSKLKGTKLAVWGHIKPYVSAGNRLDMRLERWQMRKADRVFAYTPGGARFAERQGVPAERITTVMNTVDTETLLTEISRISTDVIYDFAQSNGFDPQNTVCFIGGLDKSKRIDFLADALDQLWVSNPLIKILICGQGPENKLLSRAYQRRQAIPLGYIDESMKSLVLASTKAICMPGRIGLIAVDALVSRRPIITTSWPFHAPEVEYLVEGESLFTTADDPREYSREIQRIVHRPSAGGSFHFPTIENMTVNFADGIYSLLNMPSK